MTYYVLFYAYPFEFLFILFVFVSEMSIPVRQFYKSQSSAVVVAIPPDEAGDTEEENDASPDEEVADADAHSDETEPYSDEGLSASEPSDDESGTARTSARIRWKKQKRPTLPIKFQLQSGADMDSFAACDTALDYFLTMIDEILIARLVDESNLYAMQRFVNQGGRAVVPVTRDEILTFIGITLMMGYHKLPSYTNYWSDLEDMGVDCIRTSMSRNRYSQILSILHVKDNSSRPPNDTDRLYKIRPMITHLNEQFQKLYVPGQYQSIDEAMILFKGRSSIKQYNPMKPIKRGYKLWCRAETKGYINQFDVYQGKAGNTAAASNDIGLGGRVVMNLASSIVGKGHVLFFDNYFTSLPLMENLKANNIYACGTVRSQRKMLPVLAKDSELKRGDMDWRVSANDVLFVKWKDNRVVHFLSTAHGTEVGTASRRLKDGTQITVSRPELLASYNANMGGVDHADMLRSLYGYDRKSRKWWHRLFSGMIDIAMVNSFIIYKELLNG